MLSAKEGGGAGGAGPTSLLSSSGCLVELSQQLDKMERVARVLSTRRRGRENSSGDDKAAFTGPSSASPAEEEVVVAVGSAARGGWKTVGAVAAAAVTLLSAVVSWSLASAAFPSPGLLDGLVTLVVTYVTTGDQPLIPLTETLALRLLPTRVGLASAKHLLAGGFVVIGVAAPLSFCGLFVARNCVARGLFVAAAVVVAVVVAPACAAPSGYAAVAANLLGTVLVWKSVSALCISAPAAHRTASWVDKLTYLASPVPVVPSPTDPSKPQLAARTLRGLAARLADLGARFLALILLLSLGFGAPKTTDFFKDPLELYAEVWLVYHGISASTAAVELAVWALAGREPRASFRSPLLASTSPFAMWSRRWNMGVRDLFHETIYLPLRASSSSSSSSSTSRSPPAWFAALAAFAASGALHEVMLAHTPAAGNQSGRQMAYFLSQVPFILAWRPCVERPLTRLVPWSEPLRTALAFALTNLALFPLAPLFVDSLSRTGLFLELREILPQLLLLNNPHRPSP